MAEKHVFLGRVLHNGKEYIKGSLCPPDLHSHMNKMGLIAPLPKPVEPVEQPKQDPAPSKPVMPSDKA